MAEPTSNSPISSPTSTTDPAVVSRAAWLDRRCSALGLDVKTAPAVKQGSVMLVNPADFGRVNDSLAPWYAPPGDFVRTHGEREAKFKAYADHGERQAKRSAYADLFATFPMGHPKYVTAALLPPRPQPPRPALLQW